MSEIAAVWFFYTKTKTHSYKPPYPYFNTRNDLDCVSDMFVTGWQMNRSPVKSVRKIRAA